MALTVLPRVERMTLAVIEAVPEWHPEHGSFEPFPVHAWVVRHSGVPAESNLHDETWEATARRSLERLRSLAPVACHLSHDPDVVMLEP